MTFERRSMPCPRSKRLVPLIACLSLALFLGGEKRVSAQPDFRVDFYGSQKLAKAAARKIASKWNGQPLRVAVFLWGDDAGGMPEDEKQVLLDAYLRFNMELRKQANNRFTVLGPESIARELKARKTDGQDLAGIGFGQPEKVSDWLKTALNGEVQLALLGRKPQRGTIADLELVDLSGKGERISVEEDGSVMHRWIHHAEETDYSKMTIIPELFLQVEGETERRPVKLYSSGNGGSVAIIPSELRPKLGTGDVTMQIELNHSGKWPEMAMEGNRGYRLAADRTRLCAVAVAIDGQSTLAERRTHFITGKPLSVYPRLPAEQLRKWLIAQPGHVVVPNGNTFRVDKLKQGVGHGKIPIIGFQEDSESARLFTLCAPAEGAAEAAGIHSSPGVIWITAFAEKKQRDRLDPNHATGPDSAIPLRMGRTVANAVNAFDVYCYNTPIEEHVILLRMSDKDDPKKEEFRKPYPAVPPLPVTN